MSDYQQQVARHDMLLEELGAMANEVFEVGEQPVLDGLEDLGYDPGDEMPYSGLCGCVTVEAGRSL